MLTAGHRVWLGDEPPPGEVKSESQLVLRIGWTF
jgi:hypothetical protein